MKPRRKFSWQNALLTRSLDIDNGFLRKYNKQKHKRRKKSNSQLPVLNHSDIGNQTYPKFSWEV